MHPERKSIGELAYRIWQARGCPEGTAEQDWLDAERQLRSPQRAAEPTASDAIDRSLQETFPASDPPASRRPDVPPANSDAKWKAADKSRTSAQVSPSRRSKSAHGKPSAESPG